MGSSAPNPFIEHRQHLDIHHYALARGLTDRAFVELVTETDERVRATDGVGFVETPLIELETAVASDRGAPRVVAKVETGAVGGSHKARHLFGLILHLLVTEATDPARSTWGPGVGEAGSGQPELAIASCGNAALGAAVVARATGRALRVFVPTTANPVVLDRLDRLGALVTQCPRTPTTVGDPCVAALDDAVARGARPFTVQGPRCPEAIDGCRTMGLELGAQLDEAGLTPGAIYVQIGGGALATAVMDGLVRAWPRRDLPRLHPVQAATAHPYVAGWRRVARAVLGDDDPGRGATDRERATRMSHRLGGALDGADAGRVRAELVRHGELIAPWPETPHSVASGILDDVTYDWLTVAVHQTATGGWPVLVDEARFVDAVKLAAPQVEPPPDATGAAGLAGWLTQRDDPAELGRVAELSVVLLTGTHGAEV